jgi:hypothetical protein
MPTTEIDIANRALAKNHVNEKITSLDGTLVNATSSNFPTTIMKDLYPSARKQILRLAPWTCVKTRKKLASQVRVVETEYAEGELVVGLHSGIYSVYECTTAGTSGSGSVTWPTSSTVTDGTVVWTFRFNVKTSVLSENYLGFIYNFPIPSDYINQVEFVDELGKVVVAEIEGERVFSNTANLVLVYVPDETNPDKWDELLQETIVTHIASVVSFPITGSHENEVAFAQAAQGMVSQALSKSIRERRQGQKVGTVWFPGLFDRGQP